MSECLHIAHAFERAAEFDVIHNSFDFLPLTYSGLVETPVADDDPRLLVAADPAGLPALQREHRLRRDQRCRPASEPRLPRDDPPRDRHRRLRAPPVARRVPPLLRPDPPRQGDGGGDRRRRADGASARPRGNRPGRALLRGARGAAARRRPDSLPRPGRAGRAGGAPRRRPRPAPPDLVRGAVRLQRRRGDGVRDARHRLPARLDARADRGRRRPASWSTTSRPQWPPSTARTGSIGPRSASTPSLGSESSGWSTSTSTPTRAIV